MGQTNRNLAAKHSKAKSQKVDFVKGEITKAYNYVTVSDADRLTAAIASRPSTIAVQGKDVRAMPANKTMRQYLRSMF